jgi:hypothetical protein
VPESSSTIHAPLIRPETTVNVSPMARAGAVAAAGTSVVVAVFGAGGAVLAAVFSAGMFVSPVVDPVDRDDDLSHRKVLPVENRGTDAWTMPGRRIKL